MVTIRTSISMTETCISATLAGIGYYSSGTWWENVEEWENLRKEKKKCTQWIFVGIFILVMIEDAKEWVNQKKKKIAQDRILALAYNYDTM